MSAYPHLFSPIEVGPFTLPNRLMMGSMHTGLETPDGAERLAAFYGARARGGVGLIVTGGWSPNAEGRLVAADSAFDNAEIAATHRVITDAVHEAGARIVLQLVHAGRYAYHGDLVAPSAIKSPINRDAPRALTGPEVEGTIEAFANAAALAVGAGYDGVEVMGSEGYLLSQFLAERTNHRDDEWGGSLEARARFVLETVARVRAAMGPDRLLVYRISALELVDGGLDAKESGWLAAQVEQAGADCLDTGIGWHEARIPTIAAAVPRGGFAYALERIKSAVSIPVIATNRINTPEVAEEIIATGKADMASLARPLLADADFGAKAAAGEDQRINTCIACNQACLDHYFEGKIVSCLVNPYAVHETERVLTPADEKKAVAVVGAGPAGVTAATTLAERGHDVTLFEASDRIGGQFNLARQIPSKEEFNESIRYWSQALDRAGVTTRLGERVAADDLASAFDEVVLATGITPRTGIFEGEDHQKVATYLEILSGAKTAGEKVAIIGGGGIGFDVALYLVNKGSTAHLSAEAFRAEWGVERPVERHAPKHEVTMLKRSEGAFGRSLGKSTGWVHRMELANAGVQQIAGVTYRKVDDAGLHIEVEGEPRTLDVDTVIICAGQLPNDALAEPLRAAGRSVHVIGGAKKALELDAKRAIAEGVDLALAI